MTRARDLAAGTFEQATGGVLKLETSDTTVTDGSVLGKIEFKAPDEASGTDAILVGAAIEAVAEGTFAADNNATELVFKTGASAAADAKMTLTSGGNLGIGTSSPSSPLQIQSSNNQIRLVDSQNTSMYCVIETISDAGLSFNADVGNAAASSRIQFNVDNNEKMRIDSSGAVTMPHQPAFSCKLSENQGSLAPSNTHTILFVEIFDQNADFASNAFTAPVTGKYQLQTNLYVNSMDDATAFYQLMLVTSNRTYYAIIDPRAFDSDPAQCSLQISVLADMDANDTASVNLQLGGGGSTQSSIYLNSNFSGYLVA